MRWLISLMALLPAVAGADVDQRFAKMRDVAEKVGSLSEFIEGYAGSCGPLMTSQCEQKRKDFRRAADGRKHYMIVTEESASVLSMGDANPISGEFTLNLTPFFAGGDGALTHGAPAKTDANGNAVLPFIRIPAKVPDGWSMQLMSRQVAARALRLQLVFTPEGVWTLPRKGGGPVRGVRARFDGVIVQIGRTGEVIGTWFAK
ncbi:MAG: hypothetical protein INH41_11470 [Myxococcaceae bacterium]|jgi:hypothetical protein|nr:hypothetical protein [Myxococcaceae bacterium]MCA3013001.1 hypothetical protein [Myxococcaceae bacterium]